MNLLADAIERGKARLDGELAEVNRIPADPEALQVRSPRRRTGESSESLFLAKVRTKCAPLYSIQA